MAQAYTCNRCYNNRLKQTHFFALTVGRPTLSNIRVLGSECYAYKQEKKKLDPRCTKGIFLGYDKLSPAYLMYFPEISKVMKHRAVKKFPLKNVLSTHPHRSRELARRLNRSRQASLRPWKNVRFINLWITMRNKLWVYHV